MAQKNATPSKEQQESIRKNGLRPWEWTVLQNLHHTMIIKHRFSGEVKLIKK